MLGPILLGSALVGIVIAGVVAFVTNQTPASREGGLEIAETKEVILAEPDPVPQPST